MRTLRWLAFVCFLPLALLAQMPRPILPEGVGVNIHFVRGHERDLDLIAAAGFKFVRMDFHWAAIERQKGTYQWADYDELTANLKKRGLGAIYILDYIHSAYEPEVETLNPITQKPERRPASPRHPESIAAFARWAAAAAQHYQGERIIWEIYNEPNGFFWKPKPNVQEYIALAAATAKSIRSACPKAVVIGPAISGFDPPFMDAFLTSGILESINGVSVHPYRPGNQSPETAVPEYTRLRQQITLHQPKNLRTPLPIISGEWGYSTDGKDVSPEQQAQYLVRQQLCNLLHGIPLSIWYDWKNDGPDRAEREHNFGTVTEDLTPKPAYLAIQLMTREFSGYKIMRRTETGNEKDFIVLLVRNRGESKLAAWTIDTPHQTQIALSRPESRPISATSMDGKPLSFQTQGKSLSLPLTASPIYVNLKSLHPAQLMTDAPEP